MNETKLYIITGLPYSGKSVLSRELMKRYSFSYVSVDDEITKGKYNVPKMNQDDWNDVYSRAFEELESLLSIGKTVIFDGASLKRKERESLRAFAEKLNAVPKLIYVNTSPKETKQRWLKNMSTKERAHLKEETINKALNMFEIPTAEEQPIIYNATLDLNEWVKKNII